MTTGIRFLMIFSGLVTPMDAMPTPLLAVP